MAPAPSHTVYEYRELDSLDEVNRLAREEGFDLLQAVASNTGLRYIVRRAEDAGQGRQAGFSAPTGD